MRTLLLLAFVAFFPLSASAQWDFSTVFPADTLETDGNGMHGVAVDPDGKVWVQTFGATDSVQVAELGNEFRSVRVIYIFNPDGSEASLSPLKFIDYADGVTPRDTLGGYVFRNSTGALAWEGRSNRGLRADADGNILVSSFKTIFKLNYQTGEGLARTRSDEYCAQTQATADNNGNVYTMAVCPGVPIKQYDADLNFVANVADLSSNFSRGVLVSSDGNTFFETAYENPYTIVHQRPDEFSPFDSLGVTLAGMRTESAAINPSTGRYWFSSGNPLNVPNDYVDGDGNPVVTNYALTSWYAFEFDDLFDGTGAPVLNPTAVDSLKYVDVLDGRPRGLAFTADGNTAYVVLFSQAGAVQRFNRGSTAADGTPGTFASALDQNQPNPFAGSTRIGFDLDRSAQVTLRVFDSTGRQVATLADGPFVAGPHSVEFSSNGLAAGVYVYTLNVDGDVSTRRMMVIR